YRFVHGVLRAPVRLVFLLVLFLLPGPPQSSTLFPYTTLFRSRAALLSELFARATAPERDFLVRLLLGELRQGALENLVLEAVARDRKSTRLNSSHVKISYAVFCLKKKKKRSRR